MSRAHVRVPNALLYADLPDGSLRLWALLDDLCREYTSVRLSVPSAARGLRSSTSAVQKWRRALVNADWLLYEPARGRGEVTVWTPMNRARPVIHRGMEPVDNSARRVDGRVDSRTPIDLGKGGRASTLDGSGTRARTQEKNPAGRLLVLPDTELRPAAPCLLCAGSRWVDSLAFPGRVERCPVCHPTASNPF